MTSQIIAKELEGLNPEQLELASHIHGPSAGIAGPGSGKTHTIVSRAGYMIASGISPDNILMFTFTKKAANEMKARIMKRLPQAASMTVGTYHSFCSRILRKYAHYLGYDTSFTIYDTEDSRKLLKEIADDPFYKPEIILNKISGWKSRMISPKQAMAHSQDAFERKLASFYEEYQKRLKKANATDFDDLIGLVIKLLQENPGVKKEINDRYRYIFADEFQDSSEKDIELIRLLAGEDMNICVIMDDCQSIYSFRGADIDAVLNALEDTFPNMEIYLLQQNYRSTSVIVGASRNLISYNMGQIEKEIFTENEEGDKIVVINCQNQIDESTKISRLVKGLVATGEFSYKDIGILYRLSYISRSVEEQLLASGIPYTVVGGTPFYARKEVKDIMSYVRILFNKRDKQALERALNIPKRGLGDKTIGKIFLFANETKNVTLNLLEVCKEVELKGKAKKGLDDFNEVVSYLQSFLDNGCTPRELIEEIISTIDYEQYLLETEEDADDRISNLSELLSIASQYETLDDFIYNMSLNSLEDENNVVENNKVQLLTMHAAKGLEYPVVIIAGANEGVTPHYKAETAKQIEEERRLFYVAISRAEKNLFITRPKITTVRGQSQYTTESRFIGEIGDEYLIRR